MFKNKKWQISLAESCTGGKIVATLVNAKGTSKVLSQSYVTYSCDAKIKILGVKKDTLDCYSVYSKEVAKEMVEGLQKLLKQIFVLVLLVRLKVVSHFVNAITE